MHKIGSIGSRGTRTMRFAQLTLLSGLWVGLLGPLNLPVFAQENASAAADIEFFEKQVRPLLVERCYECHAGEEKNGGLLVDAKESLLKGGDTGPALVPGEPEKSRLIEAVRYKNHDLQMPPSKPLSEAEVAILVDWVKRGAPDPRVATNTVAAPLKGMSLEDGRQFWSFRPISNPPVPTVTNSDWVKTPIDAFILAKLEEQSLQPAAPADKRTLLRRATLDMTGLPPTVDEVDQFLADESPGAFQRVIDRLLQSPHYGVRWGRHWLDVARYADSNGLDENLAYGNAWRYRDYVVQSFNRDKPFDRFVTEQVAGDLLPDQSPETHIATGFLVLGAKVLAEPDREKLTMDTIDEQIDTLGKAFMGLTLGCARCHDHKFDPISQADYYALSAIFKSTKTFGDSNTGAIKHWHEISLATPEDKERLKSIDAAIAEKQKAASTFKSQAITAIRDKAREQAVDYLVAAQSMDLDTPLTEVALIAAPLGLHPRILHNCRRHLEFHADDPFFAKWHEVAAATRNNKVANVCEEVSVGEEVASGEEADGDDDTPAQSPAQSPDKPQADLPVTSDKNPIVSHYAPLFDAARKWAEEKKKDSKLKPHDDPQVMAAHAALFNNSGFLTVPAKVGFAFDAKTLEEYNRLADEARVLESFAPDLPSAMSVSDAKQVLTSVPIHIRGSHRNLGQPIERGFPKVMQTTIADPILPSHSSGRLEMADWLVSSSHPLTARVFVNRVWRWHFGVGLVGSTENFGVLGDAPTHPELLDWLARQFIQSGWSTKQLHRLIMRSSVYQMASSHGDNAAAGEAAERLDPENKWLSKYRMQRLDAEQIRDSILAVSGRLDETLGGKSVPLRNRQFVFDHTSIDHTKYDSLKRSLYLPVIRNNLYTMFEQFDFPDPTMPTGSRHSTTVAPQALLLLNSELVMDSADALASQLLKQHAEVGPRVQALIKQLFAREASDAEVQQIDQFVTKLCSATHETSVPPERAWSLVCQSLMISNEFFMVR